MAEEMRGRQGSHPPHQQQGRPRPNVVSPFPFGSPLHQGLEQSSFCGSPGQRLLLSSGPPPSKQGEVVTPRLKGREMYGGPVMFGSGSSFRRNRMLSASPYSATLRSRQAERAARSSLSIATAPSSSLPSSTASSPSPVPATDSMSSTARLILDTLDKMSTPIQDAKKMPPLVQPRAEKRKLIEEELNCSLKSPQRRRVRLGSGALSLAGPPLRKSYAPVSLSNGLSSPLPATNTKTPSPQPSPAPTPPPAASLPPSTKSSLKLKSKVVDSGRAPVSRSSPLLPLSSGLPEPPAISLSNPLPITTLPVFNLAAPTPVTNGVGGANGIETEESEKVEKLVDKEENNNKKNKRPLEEVEKVEDTRKKAATDGGPKPTFEIPSFGGNSDFSSFGNGSSPKGGNVTPCGSSKPDAAISPIFTFCSPTTVITQASLVPASVEFHFSLPTTLVNHQEASTTNSPLSRTPRTVSTQGDRRLAVVQRQQPSASPPKMMFSAMPDVTNNLVRKQPQCSDKEVAPMQRLPDLGLGPASHLRTGSVMDILGKKS